MSLPSSWSSRPTCVTEKSITVILALSSGERWGRGSRVVQNRRKPSVKVTWELLKVSGLTWGGGCRGYFGEKCGQLPMQNRRKPSVKMIWGLLTGSVSKWGLGFRVCLGEKWGCGSRVVQNRRKPSVKVTFRGYSKSVVCNGRAAALRKVLMVQPFKSRFHPALNWFCTETFAAVQDRTLFG